MIDGNMDKKYRVFRKLNMFQLQMEISPHPPSKGRFLDGEINKSNKLSDDKIR